MPRSPPGDHANREYLVIDPRRSARSGAHVTEEHQRGAQITLIPGDNAPHTHPSEIGTSCSGRERRTDWFGPWRYSKARSLRAIRSKDQPTLTRQDLTARRNRFRHGIRGAIGATVDFGNVPLWARSARPLVMKVDSRPASLGVRCDVATHVSPRHRLITTYPASLCQVALRAERSLSVMNSRR